MQSQSLSLLNTNKYSEMKEEKKMNVCHATNHTVDEKRAFNFLLFFIIFQFT